ncbi:MAG: polysaccharide biosynthesis/export family protein [Janthinobacterium lividum]
MRSRHLLRSFALLLLAGSFCALQAQFTGTAPTTAPGLNLRQTLTTDPAVLFPPDREMQLMAGDLLRVSIYGVVPSYVDIERVSLDGSVRLNLGGVIRVQGLSLKEAEAAIAERFEREQTFHNAQVQIEVTEAPEHTATVIGAVKGSVPIVGHMRLYDVLSRLGGLPANASTVLNIQRPGNALPIVVDIGNDAAHNTAGNIPIFSGDTVTVGQVGFYYVVGAVNKPGPNPLSGSVPTTVLQALSTAGGTNFSAKQNDAQLIRFTGSQRTAVSVPLKKIIDGKSEDIPLQSDDILLVPSSAIKTAIRNGGISTAIAIALAYVTVTAR